jgi:hypothetical protein
MYQRMFLHANGLEIVTCILQDTRYADDTDICLEGSLLLRALVSQSVEDVLIAIRNTEGLFAVIMKYVTLPIECSTIDGEEGDEDTLYKQKTQCEICSHALATLSHIVLHPANIEILFRDFHFDDILIHKFLCLEEIERLARNDASSGKKGHFILNAAVVILRNCLVKIDELPKYLVQEHSNGFNGLSSLVRLIQSDMPASIKESAMTALTNLKTQVLKFDSEMQLQGNA